MKTKMSVTIYIGALALSALALAVPAQEWTDENSNPQTLGWMQGFPPPEELRVMQPDSDFFSFPKMRWSVCHMRELLPTTRVWRGPGVPSTLPYALDHNIDNIEFTPLNSQETMSWQASLAANFTDGMIILHQGKVVYEYYSGCMNEHRLHAAMSMTKSLTGLLAEVLVAEGHLDETALVATLVPELAESAFANATVRQVMDMVTGLRYSEDYANPNADIWVYSQAASPLPKPAGYTGPNGYFEYLQQVQPEGEHGDAFGYKTVNSDALGWIIARTVGIPLNKYLSERIWQPIGAEHSAYYTVDGLGTPFAGGGLSASLRDMARVGLLMLQQGEWQGQALFPPAVVSNIQSGGDKAAFAKAGFSTIPGGSYRSMWWNFHNTHGAYAARGVHGQTLYIDPSANMVIVRFASFPQASNSHIDPTSLPAFNAVAEYLRSRTN